jgi:hypothetical protein
MQQNAVCFVSVADRGVGRKTGFPKAKTPAKMLAFPGLRRIITQPILCAGGNSLSREKARKLGDEAAKGRGKVQNRQPLDRRLLHTRAKEPDNSKEIVIK